MQSKTVKPIPATRIRSILPEKVNYVKIENQQMMRDIVTDFVIQNLSASNQVNMRRNKQIKYQPIAASLNLNGRKKQFQFELFNILQKYLLQEKQKMSKSLGIQPTVVGLLDFIDKIQKDNEFCRLEVEGSLSADKVLNFLIFKHKKERKKMIFQDQFQEAKENLYAKYKKVSFSELEQLQNGSQVWKDFERESFEGSQLIKSKNAISILEKEQFNHKKKSVPTKSKLKQLVDSCNIFEHPEKVQALRQQKLVNYFCKNEKELLDARHEIRNKLLNEQKNKNVGQLASLEDWITQISLSEYLFKKKYEPKHDKKGDKNLRQSIGEDMSSSDDNIQ